MTPKRIQRKRTKGWRMQEDTVYVGRGTKWGNPYRPAQARDGTWVAVDENDVEYPGYGPCGEGTFPTREAALNDCVRLFAQNEVEYELGRFTRAQARSELAGKDLACWCPESQPCHADVLLEIANKEDNK